MRRVLIFVFLISNVKLEMRTVQFMHMTRNARSNSLPVQTSYTYSKHNNDPPIISTALNIEPNKIGKLSNNILKLDDKLEKNFDDFSTADNRSLRHIDKPYATLTEYAKSKLKLWPEKQRTLKPVEEETVLNEIVRSVDEEDTRTDTRNPFDGWPYFYQGVYDYEPHKHNTDYEKAKDKHYFSEGSKNIIPVHEDVKEDYPYEAIYSTSRSKYRKRKTTENPILGDQPFFSFILNDYFDKTYEDDPLTLAGLPWASDFDNEIVFHNNDKHRNRMRHIEDGIKNNLIENTNHQFDYDTLKDSERLRNYDNKNEIKRSERGDESQNNMSENSKHNSEKYEGFKDFADAFANKFGSEGHHKDSKYLLKMDADKGEKKKGFRKVYHKDEYQEDNEFYDNTNKQAASEEKGGATLDTGGSEALLRSRAAAALANQHDVMHRNKDYNSQTFNNNHEADKRAKGYSADINRFRDVAKHAARSNNADYIDHFVN